MEEPLKMSSYQWAAPTLLQCEDEFDYLDTEGLRGLARRARAALYITPFSYSILVLHLSILVLLSFLSQFALGISSFE